jgi:hypothetical protein
MEASQNTTANEIYLGFELYQEQLEISLNPARFKVVAMGRRSGKTLLGALECMKVAMSGGRAWWIAPSYKYGGAGWDQYFHPWGAGIATYIPDVKISLVNRKITFPSGGELQVRSADDPDSLRGYALDLAVFDECAFMKEATWTEVIRPALSDRRGKAIFISTPNAKNWFWRLWHEAKSLDDWESWQYPSWVNPYLDKAEIEKARAQSTDRVFKQEYGAEFLEAMGSIFRNVRDQATAEIHEEPIKGHSYAVGADWGRVHDFTVIVVLDLTTNEVVWIERFTGIAFKLQLERLRTILRKFDPIAFTPEANSFGMPLVEQLEGEGWRVWPPGGFVTGNATKGQATDALALAFERKAVRIPPAGTGDNYEQLIEELEAVVEDRTPGGLVKYSVPEGMHDDCYMAAILAWTNAGDSGDLITIIGDEEQTTADWKDEEEYLEAVEKQERYREKPLTTGFEAYLDE